MRQVSGFTVLENLKELEPIANHFHVSGYDQKMPEGEIVR